MTDTGSRTFTASQLEEVAKRLFMAAGAPPEVAVSVSRLLVWSERIGHPSHGMLRIPDYIERIDQGRLIPDAECTVASETVTSTLIDGGWGFGQVAAARAVEHSLDKAAVSGMAAAGAYHINHVGRLGDFTEMAAREGMIAFAFVGGTPTGQRGNVAPYGGRQAVWGTNPLAIAIPGGDRIFSLDYATSAIAGGKAAAARDRGVDLEEDHLIDREGLPTRDPWAVLEGGAIRPFGGHKGYGLAFAVELLAGALIGAAAPELADGGMHNGFLVVVLDPGSFGDARRFRGSVDSVMAMVKDSPPAEGFDEVMIPGEPEQQRGTESDLTGILVPETVVTRLVGLGSRLGVELAL